jgi:hypothetical protein
MKGSDLANAHATARIAASDAEAAIIGNLITICLLLHGWYFLRKDCVV